MSTKRTTTPRLRQLFDDDLHSSIDVVLPNDPLEREHQRVIALRRRATQVSHIGAVATVADAQVVEAGLRVSFDIPSDATPVDLVAVARSDLRAAIAILTSIAESLASLHDAGLAHGGITCSRILRRPDGTGFIVGFDGREAPADDVAAMGSLVLDVIPSGSLPAETAATLLRAVDSVADLRPTMSDIAQALSGVRQRTMVSPPARRRRQDPGGHVSEGERPAPPVMGNSDDGETGESSLHSIARARRHRHVRQRHSRARGALPAPILVGLASSAGTWVVALVVLGRG